MKTTALFTLLCLAVALNAQKNDYVWYLGFGGNPFPDSLQFRSSLDFSKYNTLGFNEFQDQSNIFIDGTLVSASDKDGNFMFLYNGTQIEDAAGNIMKNSQSLSESGTTYGDWMPQAGLMLPRARALYSLVKDTVYQDCTPIERRSAENSEALDDINISIAPNPAISEVSVYSNAEIESLDIYTVTGEVIHTAEVNNRAVTIDIAEYTSGMYFISLHMLNGSIEVRKLLVH